MKAYERTCLSALGAVLKEHVPACHDLMHRVGGDWADEFVDTFWQMWQTRDKK